MPSRVPRESGAGDREPALRSFPRSGLTPLARSVATPSAGIRPAFRSTPDQTAASWRQPSESCTPCGLCGQRQGVADLTERRTSGSVGWSLRRMPTLSVPRSAPTDYDTACGVVPESAGPPCGCVMPPGRSGAPVRRRRAGQDSSIKGSGDRSARWTARVHARPGRTPALPGAPQRNVLGAGRDAAPTGPQAMNGPRAASTASGDPAGLDRRGRPRAAQYAIDQLLSAYALLAERNGDPGAVGPCRPAPGARSVGPRSSRRQRPHLLGRRTPPERRGHRLLSSRPGHRSRTPPGTRAPP